MITLPWWGTLLVLCAVFACEAVAIYQVIVLITRAHDVLLRRRGDTEREESTP